MKQYSARGQEWISFSMLVLKHIEEYTVPQYGDKPNDPLEEWEIKDCMRMIKKYHDRHGKGQRGKTEELRDLLKIAHYAGVAHTKHQEKENDKRIRRTIML